MTMTVFLRTQMAVDLMSANYLMASMYYALVRLFTNGVTELSLTIIRLPVVYKQRSFYLYPAWAYSIPASITMVLATTIGSVTFVLMFLFGGFILPRRKLVSKGNCTLGREVLISHGLDFDGYFYWISLGALLGFTVLFDLGFSLALTYLKPPKMSGAIISRKKLSQLLGREGHKCSAQQVGYIGRMVLPFEPLTMTFKDVQYFVDTPPEMRKHGFPEKKLQLLRDITGAFRPGVLTALMGISRAGKTTLMDVLSGRKTGGTVEGEIRIGGHPKVQNTFARISGYCEQNDIHSPQITVE
ncbi:ATP-binding cassette transporter, putative [Ricinus communis]|uniref:ATP-binding cassette transporter, putative n=1 Tax=Ricinus communis TaxID=3988 RepID=B9RZZ2_RICCO|nr:ATP-binding cassette transporter, putative [Ricinus communis]